MYNYIPMSLFLYSVIAAFNLFCLPSCIYTLMHKKCSVIKEPSAFWLSKYRPLVLLLIPALHFYDSIPPLQTTQITSPVDTKESYLLLKRVDRFSSSSFPSSKRNTRFAIITVSKRWAMTNTYQPNYSIDRWITKLTLYKKI